jgi:hypothetical protein
MGSHWTEKTLALENIKAADQDLIIDNANPSPSLSVPRPTQAKATGLSLNLVPCWEVKSEELWRRF